MNKQEAIEKIKSKKISNKFLSNYGLGYNEALDEASYIINQIDELKPVVPKFVAEWIKYCKSNKLTLLGAFDPGSEHGIGLADTFTEELWKGIDWAKRNQETFARAWLDGYEVEKEQLYKVIIPHTSNYKNQKQYLVKQGNNWFFCGNDVNRFKYHFTKGQIEAAGFGWVFEQGFVKEVE